VNGVTTTRTVATVSFTADANGYAVKTTTTLNAADGSKTIDNVTSNPTGGIASERILNTNSTGLSKISSGRRKRVVRKRHLGQKGGNYRQALVIKRALLAE